MRHVHADMIIAKAENDELIKFVKRGPEWLETQMENWGENKYFLCLPQHNENGQCLHWLNGGKVLADNEDYWNDAPQTWCNQNDFMNKDVNIKIKPRKEKRWIGHFMSGDDFCLTEFSYTTINQLKGSVHAPNGFDDWQFIEIEVEV
tara:strand:+ start:178 stop:618 length:441 start_codon:yes stop_codon:yes gene_type:complete